MKELTNFEKSIIEEIIRYNEEKYPFIKEHLSCLEVKRRRYTGVGMYLNFRYSVDKLPNNIIDDEHILISSDKTLEIDTLSYGINYVLNVTKGKFDFLELVTNGEDWDGSYKGFKFI